MKNQISETDHLFIILGHKWSESEALVRAVGTRLKKIYLALRGYHGDLNLATAAPVPKLDYLLELCPKIQDLTISFGPLTLNANSSFDDLNNIKMETLKEVTVHTYMTKKVTDFKRLGFEPNTCQFFLFLGFYVSLECLSQFDQNKSGERVGYGGKLSPWTRRPSRIQRE